MPHVLIIEDETLIALDIEDILTRSGATSFDIVDTELGAVEAALARRPSIITADVALKTGLGPLAVEAITAQHGPIPVIYITSMPEKCQPSDTAHVLRKPVNEQAVMRAYKSLQTEA
jgi:CheY-like chemotaxis protein